MSEKEFPAPDSPDEVTREVTEAALRLVHSQSPDVWEETGGGNRKRMRLDRLDQELIDDIMRIQERYDGLSLRDREAFKLQHALFSVAHMATSGETNIQRYVSQTADKKPSKEMRNATMRTYDSLGVLENAFRFIVPSASGERSEELVEEFTDNFPSPMWEDQALKAEVLEAVDKAYQIIGTLSAPNHESVVNFIKKMRTELLSAMGYSPLPRHGRTATQKSARQRALHNLRIVAWQDWEQLPVAE